MPTNAAPPEDTPQRATVPPETLQAALGLQRGGPPDLARTVLLALNEQYAPHPRVLSALGILALQAQAWADAERWLAASLNLDTKQASVHSNRGIALAQLGGNEANSEAALAAFAAAIDCDPTYADAYYNRGSLYQRLAQPEKALADFEQATLRAPQMSKAWQGRAVLLGEKKDWVGELACYDVLVKLQPDDANTHYNRANDLLNLARRDEAIAGYQAALAIDPQHAGAHNNLSTVYYARQQFELALAHAEQALAIQPEFPGALTNRGNALRGLGRYSEAVACYDQALAQTPDFVSAEWNKALLLLLCGDYLGGWAAYESRWKRPGATIPGTKIPGFVKPETTWAGTKTLAELAGKTLLIYPEQGLGDLIQFCRYVPVLEAAGVKVVLQTRPALHALLQSLSPSCHYLEQNAAPPPFDWHCPVMSLPHICRTSLETVPQLIPYLQADPMRVQRWAMRLAKLSPLSPHAGKPRVGLVWAGNPKHTNDHNRSLSLAQLKPLFELPVEWHCLQKEVAPADAEQLAALGVHQHAQALTDFSETAALCANMDHIVSVDTSVAHLAGALGRPLSILLPTNPDFRWLLDRTDSPWYPSASLYRQREAGEWAEPVQRLCADLHKAFVAQSAADAPAASEPAQALPDHPVVLSAAASMAFQQGLNAQGKQLVQRSLALDAKQPQAWLQLGACLAAEADWAGAVKAFAAADALQPNQPQTLYNLGVVLKECGRFVDALDAQRRAHVLAPNDPEIRWNRALLELQQGHYTTGWALYEARWERAKAATRPAFKQPLWLGQTSLAGKNLLVLAEQGFGDCLQMVRYLPALAAQAKSLTATVPSALLLLMQAQPWPVRWVDRYEDVPPFDLQCPVMSLPLANKTTFDTIPAKVPYLQVDPARTAAWQARLGVRGKARIGIVWSGNPLYQRDQRRSLALQALQTWFALPLEWHCLQKEADPADRAWLVQHGVRIHAENLRDFADTAALCQQMDLIISVDTAVAHLAGALGRPVWIMLPAVPDYRWLLVREDSPWYPTARLFRQPQSGDWADVVQQIATRLRAAYVAPAEAFQHYLAQHRAGAFGEAANGYRTLLERSPQDAMLMSLLGTALFQQSQIPEAENWMRRALAIAPDKADGWNNLSLVLNAQGQFDEALACTEKAIALQPAFADAHSNRGLILLALKRHDAALAALAEAIRLNPQHTDAWFNQGNVYQDLKNAAMALESFDQAIQVQPADARVWHNRGNALNALGRFAEALESYSQAVQLDPQHVKARYNRGVILEEQGHFAEADRAYQDALSVAPEHLKSRWNRVLLQLLHGDYRAGWAGYELRWSLPEAPPKPKVPQPEWQGQALPKGTRLLLTPEQGLGDLIQMSRYALDLACKGIDVIIQSPAALLPVLRTLPAPVTLVAQSKEPEQALPNFDYYCPVMSLPHVCRSTLATLQGSEGYLGADPATRSAWQKRLGAAKQLRVGLVWSGNPNHKNDHRRSLDFVELTPFWDLPVEWHCLQKVIRAEDLERVKAVGIQTHTEALSDFGETAALCELMDVVISVDTSVAHLAGAMGKPVWLMLPFVPDFRWLLEREDSPWYASARLFRQTTPGDWGGVVSAIATALGQFGLR